MRRKRLKIRNPKMEIRYKFGTLIGKVGNSVAERVWAIDFSLWPLAFGVLLIQRKFRRVLAPKST
jgi:hypothetical protein